MTSYASVKETIEQYVADDRPDKEALGTIHRQLEMYNAHKIIANEDDQLMKDVQFLVRSAMFLMDVGNPNDWRCQLEAVVTLLNSSCASS